MNNETIKDLLVACIGVFGFGLILFNNLLDIRLQRRLTLSEAISLIALTIIWWNNYIGSMIIVMVLLIRAGVRITDKDHQDYHFVQDAIVTFVGLSLFWTGNHSLI